jgi:hypothetical protein
MKAATFLWVAAIVGLTSGSGCALFRKNMGASADNDQNVLTGGPVTGTHIKELPKAVRKTLAAKASGAEIAAIDKQTQDGRLIYRIILSEGGLNRSLYILDDGNVLENRKDSHYRYEGPNKPLESSLLTKP